MPQPSLATLAFDLGAESGRAMLGQLRDDRLTLTQVYRFPNRILTLPSGLHWDITGLWAHLLQGLTRANTLANDEHIDIACVGVDTWGVDFALLGTSGQLLGLPFAYRDARNSPAMQRTLQRIDRRRLYAMTGLQPLPFNTLFQLVAQQQAEPGTLEHADRLLNMPDLLHFFLSGERVNEATIASTTATLNPATGRPHRSLLRELDLPDHLLHDPHPPGSTIGTLRSDVSRETGIGDLRIILPPSHDTAAAVAAVPVSDADAASGRWAYLSSGTWSLLGAELDSPILTDDALDAGFTNERGVGGGGGVDQKIRFLKNIAGLWLVQQVRADAAARGDECDYADLTRLADAAPPLRTLIDPDHPPFAQPGDMLAKIDAYADSTHQPRPDSLGAYVRCCLESLALTYRRTLRDLQRITARRFDRLYLVGGGGQNTLLNQMTADATGIEVIVGPYEATAAGNALTQAIGLRLIADLPQLRAVVRGSFDPQSFTPTGDTSLPDAAERFETLVTSD